MIFCTPWFLIFSLAAAVLYVAVRPWRVARLALLMAASIFFYLHFAGGTGFVVMAALAAFTYFAALRMPRGECDPPRGRGWVLALCLAPSILALLYFRYYGFLCGSILDGMGWLGVVASPGAREWVQKCAPAIVPLGISFFGFEFCHYLVDVWKRHPPVRNPLHFGIFALFYPRLASGPIVRYQQIVPQLEKLRPVRSDDVSYGLLRIAVGCTKKFVLADPAAYLIATSFQPDQVLFGTDVIALCGLLYLRIYMDFGGYCDMAIGIARLWGVRLPENFRFPWIAVSPSEFWRRWHITLSTWIRDYIYIPLGGGRVPAWRRSFNLLFAMSLCGLWHGSAWNFVLWGAAHGVALQVGHGLSALRGAIFTGAPQGRSGAIGHAFFSGAGWLSTQIFVSLSWVLFFFSIEDTAKILSALGRWW